MIIFVSIEASDLDDVSADDIAPLFSELLRASRRGNHRVVVPRALGMWIRDNVKLSDIDFAHLRRLSAEYTQLAGLVASATILSRVVIGSDLRLLEGGRIIEIGHNRLLSGNFLDRTVLLLENAMSDGKVLEEMLLHEAKRRSFGEISFSLANGGGSATAVELSRIVANDNFVVCVCDTDLVVRGGAKSATCNGVLTQACRILVPGIVSTTPGREVENFLPIDILELLYLTDKPAECAKLREIFLNQGDFGSEDCVWLYLDLKSGLPAGKLLTQCNTPEKLAWATAKFNTREEDLRDVTFFGLGEDIIVRYLDNDAARSAFHKFSRSQYWSKHFSCWLENLLWGTCGRKELRTG